MHSIIGCENNARKPQNVTNLEGDQLLVQGYTSYQVERVALISLGTWRTPVPELKHHLIGIIYAHFASRPKLHELRLGLGLQLCGAVCAVEVQGLLLIGQIRVCDGVILGGSGVIECGRFEFVPGGLERSKTVTTLGVCWSEVSMKKEGSGRAVQIRKIEASRTLSPTVAFLVV